MELAVGAGALGSPDRAFAQVQLGLRLGQGDLAAAEREMRAALAERPDDAPATAGLARVLAARGALEPAAELYSRAIDLLAARVPGGSPPTSTAPSGATRPSARTSPCRGDAGAAGRKRLGVDLDVA